MQQFFINIRRIFFSSFFCLMLLGGCSHYTAKKVNVIPPEIIGVWSSEDGCTLTFSKDANNLLLVKFNNLQNNELHEIALSCVKNGIMTQFNSLKPETKFSGTFVEGELIINSYCKKPLHKIST